MAAGFWSADETRLFDEQAVPIYPKTYCGPTPEETAQLVAAVWRAVARGDLP